jgi:hypothetical protein
MTNANRTTTTKRVPMDSMRKTALVAGVFYLITFISIPSLALYGPVFNDPDWILGSGSDAGVRLATVLELIVALAGIGTALALYPVVKRQNEAFALGFIASRTLEAGMIFTGIMSVLSLVTLRQDLGAVAGADAAPLVTTGASLVASYNSAFLLGQSFMPPLNALLLGYLMYRSGLVPRILPVLGLIGAPLLFSADIGILLGINEKISTWSVLAVIPIFVWELSLGLYLTFKGFKSSAPIMVAAAARSGSPDATKAGAA